MKTAVILSAAFLLSTSCFAQGTISFTTRFADGINAPVVLNEAGGPGPGPLFSAGLWLVSNGDLLFLPSSLTTFRDGSSNPVFAMYIVPVLVEVPAEPFTFVNVRMRAWETAAGSYEAAQRRGESGNIFIRLGSPTGSPGEMPETFTGFVIPAIPEPSAFVLLLAGGAAMAAWSAKRQ